MWSFPFLLGIHIPSRIRLIKSIHVGKSFSVLYQVLLSLVIASIATSCNDLKTEEVLVKKACSSCHMVPSAGDLDKTTWENEILPRMGAWLGMEPYDILMKDVGASSYTSPFEEGIILPDEPLLTEKEWESIKNYFLSQAPEKLEIQRLTPQGESHLFEPNKYFLPGDKAVADNTLVHISEKNDRIYVGGRDGSLDIYNKALEKIDSFRFFSGPVDIYEQEDGSIDVLLIGNIMPNNQDAGQVMRITPDRKEKQLIRKLQRPVFMKSADFNNDGRQDYVIGNFGFIVGKLAVYVGMPDGSFIEQVLLYTPGAIKAVVEDVDQDGHEDIIVLMAQSNEAVYWFQNMGNLRFKQRSLLRFPPQYGSSDMAWVDINKDGFKDLAIVHGDNADFSLIKKPYHGLRIYLNDGKLNFTESQYIQMAGATRLLTRDFDQDGDLDFLIACNFADFDVDQQGSLYFLPQDDQGQFALETVPGSEYGRWLIMDSGTLSDGKNAVILGSHVTDMMADTASLSRWKREKVNFLVLKTRE